MPLPLVLICFFFLFSLPSADCLFSRDVFSSLDIASLRSNARPTEDSQTPSTRVPPRWPASLHNIYLSYYFFFLDLSDRVLRVNDTADKTASSSSAPRRFSSGKSRGEIYDSVPQLITKRLFKAPPRSHLSPMKRP